jgi:hypothetical protein
MDTVFRIFSTLGLLILHMYMYGWNVYAWQQVRINYPFIFEFSPGTELRYREVLLVCTAFTSVLVSSMIVHIIASTSQAHKRIYTSEFAPLGVTVVMTLYDCPNIPAGIPLGTLYTTEHPLQILPDVFSSLHATCDFCAFLQGDSSRLFSWRSVDQPSSFISKC